MTMRTFQRTQARALYSQFTRRWRRELRLSGLYGKPGSPRHPTFNQWLKLTQKNAREQPALSQQAVQAQVEETLIDPWAGGEAAAFEAATERGVMTIPIAGDDE
jgi:hypothetical protein